jgi:hypothetical protein
MHEKNKKGAGLLDGEDILTYNGKGNRNQQVNCRKFCLRTLPFLNFPVPS